MFIPPGHGQLIYIILPFLCLYILGLMVQSYQRDPVRFVEGSIIFVISGLTGAFIVVGCQRDR